MLLYRSLIGSRLYGTHRPDSDYDWIEVYSSMRPKPRQKVIGETDTIKVNLSQFMHFASSGRHQYLESMFNPDRQETDMFYDMRMRFYPDTAQAVNLYRRTIANFGNRKGRKTEKSNKTALRMTYNLEQLLEYGRFNPALDPALVAVLDSYDTDDAHRATLDRMNYLSERYKI